MRVEVGVDVCVEVRVGVGVRVVVGVEVGVRMSVGVGADVGVTIGTGVVLGDGAFFCLRQPMTVQAKASATAMILQAEPKYDSEFRGFTESGVVNLVNPFNSLSYPPNSHLIILNRETAVLQLIPLLSSHWRGLSTYVSLTKNPRYVTISANNSIIWTLLSRGVEGPALRNPGNRFGD